MEWYVERRGTVGSTMEIAAGLAAEGAPSGLVVVAEEQTAGRGRLGRVWLAPAGTCLLMTALFRPSLAVARSGGLSRLVAREVGDAIEEVTGVRPSIKDPNDLLVEGKKLAGILCQTCIRGDQLEYLLIGIGINVNIPPDQLPLPTATSLLAVTGMPQDRERILSAVLSRLVAVPELDEAAPGQPSAAPAIADGRGLSLSEPRTSTEVGGGAGDDDHPLRRQEPADRE